VEFNDGDFFKERFTREEIKALLQGKSAFEMFSFKSPSFKALGLDQAKLKDNDLINLMLKEPRFIRRPVVKIEKNVYFGADSKALAEILRI
jgi:arsenate reductase-like glutaredoxin family protein